MGDAYTLKVRHSIVVLWGHHLSAQNEHNWQSTCRIRRWCDAIQSAIKNILYEIRRSNLEEGAQMRVGLWLWAQVHFYWSFIGNDPSLFALIWMFENRCSNWPGVPCEIINKSVIRARATQENFVTATRMIDLEVLHEDAVTLTALIWSLHHVLNRFARINRLLEPDSHWQHCRHGPKTGNAHLNWFQSYHQRCQSRTRHSTAFLANGNPTTQLPAIFTWFCSMLLNMPETKLAPIARHRQWHPSSSYCRWSP